MCEHRGNSEKRLENLRPFNELPPEELRAITQLGGIASGKARRRKAELRSAMIEVLAGVQLAEETRAEYRAAVLRVVRAERMKQKRRIVRD